MVNTTLNPRDLHYNEVQRESIRTRFYKEMGGEAGLRSNPGLTHPAQERRDKLERETWYTNIHQPYRSAAGIFSPGRPKQTPRP